MQKIANWIGGKFVPPQNQTYLPNFDPALGRAYSEVPDSSSDDVQSAVQMAQAAFSSWSRTPNEERSRFLRKIARGIEARLEEFARAESVDTGKPLKVATQVDIPRSIQNFDFFADATTQFSSEAHLTHPQAINFTVRAPLGVVACIAPWNLPLYLLTWKIAPALAAGNTVVAKPSEVTPMTAYLLSEVCAEVGLPPGVLNIVHGLGARVGTALTTHPKVAAISFTGSTTTGAAIAASAAPQFKKISLEMGGKNPNIIFADAEFETAVQETVRSSFANQGQICLCGSRIFIERSVYADFKAALVERTQALVLGDPLESNVEQGAMVSQSHFEKVMAAIELAKREGGTLLTGGHSVRPPGRCAEGWFIAPTLIENLSPHCRTNQEEIFGPVATLMPFDREDEVIQWANGTRYGLSASVWTQDITRAHRVALQIQAGMVWINTWMLRDLRTPFGGVKDSGVGREGGFEALKFFTDAKNVCIKVQ